MEFEWREGNRLRTRQARPAVTRHPRTGEMVWFNQAHLFHLTNLEPAARAGLLESFQTDELPRNAYYGDGAPIEHEALDEIRAVYQEASAQFPWRPGDVLLLDNVRIAHGRRSFTGERKIVVAMTDPFTRESSESGESATSAPGGQE
jgi:alpha-ketoglutarate-dependent taurine dioxygenase